MIVLKCPVCDDKDQYDDYATHCINCGAYINRRLALIEEAEELCERLVKLYHEHRYEIRTNDPRKNFMFRRKFTNHSKERIEHAYNRALIRLTRRLGNDDFVGFVDNTSEQAGAYSGATVRL